MKKHVVTCTFALLLTATQASAQKFDRPLIDELIKTNVSAWIQEPVVVESIKSQNLQSAALGQDDINTLDQTWRAEAKALEAATLIGNQDNVQVPMIQGKLGNPLSKFLQKVKEQNQGLFTELFIMDNQGLNVGQSNVTSDYWQGDEDKWQQTYLKGPGAIHIGEMEFDDSSNRFVYQVSMPIIDPQNEKPIGALTFSISLAKLLQTSVAAN